jgi:phage terminase small subunit
MGRPPKSNELHWLTGTVSQSKNGSASFEGGRPRVPKLPPLARRAWKSACQILEQRRTLTPSDGPSLELYARTYALYVTASNQLGDELLTEVTVMDNSGAPHTKRVINPLLKLVDQLSSRLLAAQKALGLTQVDISRTRKVVEKPKADELNAGEAYMAIDITAVRRQTWEDHKAAAEAAKASTPERVAPPSSFDDEENI